MPQRRMSLAALVGDVVDGAPDVTVTGLTADSREVMAGDLFIALRGEHHDGRRYLPDAAAAGAVAALVETVPAGGFDDLPVVLVPDLRQRLGSIASHFFGEPSRALHVTAVTGTNGKTTVSQLFGQLVRNAGYSCGVIGTLGASLDGSIVDTLHTTPDAIALQRILAQWASEALPFVSMEASSHALDQGRLNAVDVDTAIFTNLTRDHLDYHGDMAAYGEAKARLFAFPSLRSAVLYGGDPFSAPLRARLAPGVTAITYGDDAGCDVRISRLEATASGLRCRLASPWGEVALRCPLVGTFNALNVAAAIAAALVAGLPLDDVAAGAEQLRPVPGRMEPLRMPGAPLVVVDYAHTPDALAKVIDALREQCRGRVSVVFGCGGDRDRGKRVLMAQAVSQRADFAVITSDNPRGEDPAAIIAEVAAAMDGAFTSRIDRSEAIRFAIESASERDCVLIAGKGHEDYQIVGAERRPFSDRDVASAVLARIAA